MPTAPNPPSPPPVATAGDVAALVREARAGLAQWVPAAVQAAAAALEGSARVHAIASDREHQASVLAVLKGRQSAFVDRACHALEALLDGTVPAAAPAPARRGALTLSLVDDDAIESDIDIAQIVQAVESAAEWELGELASLCSGLAARSMISEDTVPLHPQRIARAFHACAGAFDLERPARRLLLRTLGQSLAEPLRRVYREQIAALEQRGVRRTPYQVRQTPAGGARATGAAPTPAPGAASGADSASLERLVRWAIDHAAAEAAAGAAPPADDGAPLRLLDAPVPVGEAATPALDPRTAQVLMTRLLAHLGDDAQAPEALRALVARLDAPARHLAAHDRTLWRTIDHPLWQLFDRIAAAAAVIDELGTEPGAPSMASIESAVDALAREPKPDAAAVRRATAGVEFAVSGLLDEQMAGIESAAQALQDEVAQGELEVEMRGPILEQLRAAPGSPALRQFLLGPWTLVLATVAREQGREAADLQPLAQLVDLLIACASRPPGQALPRGQRDALLARAQHGMVRAGFPVRRVRAELSDLARALDEPAAPRAAVPAALAEPAPASAAPVGQAAGTDFTALDTVPIEMMDIDAAGRAVKDREAWLDGLRPGDRCRIFMLGRWMTAHVRWRSANGSMFVLTSRHGGKLHALSRRALERLRGAGLATTLRRAAVVQDAMDTLSFEDATGL